MPKLTWHWEGNYIYTPSAVANCSQKTIHNSIQATLT
jgi:tetratricopeptide (TPR) repeat protein